MSQFLILGRFLGEAVASEGPKRKVLCCRSAPGVRTAKLSRDHWRSALSEVAVHWAKCRICRICRIWVLSMGWSARRCGAPLLQDPYLKEAREQFQQQPNAFPISEAQGHPNVPNASKKTKHIKMLRHVKWIKMHQDAFDMLGSAEISWNAGNLL